MTPEPLASIRRKVESGWCPTDDRVLRRLLDEVDVLTERLATVTAERDTAQEELYHSEAGEAMAAEQLASAQGQVAALIEAASLLVAMAECDAHPDAQGGVRPRAVEALRVWNDAVLLLPAARTGGKER